MPVSRGFQDFILDLLGPLHPVPRRMFGGVGLFHDGMMFGLLVRVTVETDQLTRSVAGTLFAGSRPRIVEIKGIKVEADFASHMLYVTNQDKPGFIGRFGATLAGAGINIATFHLGRETPGGDAIALVEVDGVVPADVLAKVQALPQVRQAKSLRF